MLDRRALWSLPVLLGLSLGAAHLLSRAEPPTPPPSAPAPPRPPPTGPIRWIVAGGGASPEVSQVQIEQDLAQATRRLEETGPGMLLFAGGPGSQAVQVLDRDAPPADLRDRLGTLLDPRGSRDTRYRASTLDPDGAGSAEAIVSALEGAVLADESPLLVYLAGHGLGGEEPRDSRLLTWGAGDLWVEDLAAVLDAAPHHRPVRLVVTSCYAGGFADLAFTGADLEQGPAESDRCGFFATTWDRVASGCDPDPDRGAQEGYGILFLEALGGAAEDLDGDGRLSLLEAHSHARMRAGSFDVPVTTSEVFLRAAVDPDEAPEDAPPPPMPEERAVVAALRERLDVASWEAARARLTALQHQLEEGAEQLDELEREREAAREDLVGALLHRWPALEDPWRRDFAPTLELEADAIARFLDESGDAARLADVDARLAPVAERHDALLVRMAPLENLLRAEETLALAGQLRAEGGPHWLRYQRFLACERGLP
ncbi:MAG: hypothetical protein VYE22_30080 [Myxococcota bacterium]|nr:hypothetical protein [Myxococcota bacterium]